MLRLFLNYPQPLLFGILTAMFSGPGQTFLVSLFIPSMRESLGMSKTFIAGLYSAATLVSAALLPVAGRLLDRISLASFTLTVGSLLAIGCLVLSQSRDALMVFVGFFLVRNLGQGALTMISSTTMARFFGAARGKALGVANLGYPLSETIFPLWVSFWLRDYGWRVGWIFLAMLIGCFFLPAVFILLRRWPEKKLVTGSKERAIERGLPKTDTSGRGLFRDWRFYGLLPSVLIPPAFLTGLFFHQESLAQWKGWPMTVMAAGFMAFGISRVLVSFFIGPLIDRWTAQRIFPWVLIPLALSLGCLLAGTAFFWIFLYLAGAGMTMGLSMTVSNALYAELFGVRYLGSIKGIIASVIVFSTAALPVILGILLDRGTSLSLLIEGMIGLILIGMGLAYAVCRFSARH